MDEKQGTVEFNKAMALVGMMAGALIAVVVPLYALKTLQELALWPMSNPGAGQFSAWFYLAVIVLSLLIGGTVTLVSAFLGIVVPKRASGAKEVGFNIHVERGKDKAKGAEGSSEGGASHAGDSPD